MVNLRLNSASERANLVGLLVCILIGLCLCAAFGFFGATRLATGQITSFGFSVGRNASTRVALVEVEGRVAAVRLPPYVACQVGNEIALVHRPSLLASGYTLANGPNPCR